MDRKVGINEHSICQLCDDCTLLMKGDIFYEIHITIENTPDSFIWAVNNKIKLIDIELGTSIPNQLMTSVVVKGSEKYPKIEAARLLVSLKVENIKVSRVKIEATLNSPEEAKYYELHASASPNLYIDERALNLHKSKNLLKKGVALYQMYTFRSKYKEEFQDKYNELKHYDFHKIILEKCIMDTNEELDSKWLKQ